MTIQMLLIFCLCVTLAFATPDVSHLHDNHDNHHAYADAASGYIYEKPTHFVETPFVTYNQNVRTSYFPPPSGTYSTTSNEYKQHQQYDLGNRNGVNYVQQPTVQYNPNSYSYSNNYNNIPVQSNVQSLHDQQYGYDITGEQLQHNDVTIRLIPVSDSYYDTSQDQIIMDYGVNHKDIGHPHRLYKVIFIKAPSYHGKAHIAPILPRNEEKTFIYVFSKQPTFETKVTAQEQPPATSTKPNVVFIKYKTDEEAKHAEEQIKNAFKNGHVPSVGANDDGTLGLRELINTDITTLNGAGSASEAQNTVSNFVTGASGLTTNFEGPYHNIRNQQHTIATNHDAFESGHAASVGDSDNTRPGMYETTIIGALGSGAGSVSGVQNVASNIASSESGMTSIFTSGVSEDSKRNQQHILTSNHGQDDFQFYPVTKIKEEYLPPGKKYHL